VRPGNGTSIDARAGEKFTLHAAVATHPGERARNEDTALSWSRRGLSVFAVADGVGGEASGHLASRAAVRAFARSVAARIRRGEPFADACSGAMVDAGEAVQRSVSDGEPDGTRPLTTLTALCVRGTEAALVHVGDSRAYRLRDGTLSPLTEDHSVTAELVRAHAIGLSEAARHAHRNVLTQTLGAGPVQPQVEAIGLRPGDVVLLCTDGVYKAVPDDRLAQLLASSSAAQRIVEEALAREGEDNATAVTVAVQAAAARRVHWRLGVAALVVTILLAGAKAVWERSYFLGVEAGSVTLFRGLPMDFGGLRAYRTERTFATPLEEVAPAYRERLERGLWVRDDEEASRIVRELRRESR
jgi:protein phosphatase